MVEILLWVCIAALGLGSLVSCIDAILYSIEQGKRNAKAYAEIQSRNQRVQKPRSGMGD